MQQNVDNLLAAYRDALLRANKTLNLVSRQSVDKIIPVLIEESLLPLAWASVRLGSPLLDIGSGGGFPGIPLKIARPALDVTLLDGNRKKTLFLRLTIEKLQLSNAEVVWGRFEEYCALPENAGRFGTIVARGVGQLDQLLRSAVIMLKPKGELIVWSRENALADTNCAGYYSPDLLKVAPGLTLIRWEREG